MKTPEIVTLVLGVLTAFVIPLLTILIRITTKWTKVETKLDNLIEEVKSIVADKDKTHLEMYSQMREDRSVTDKRLRWLEENVWKHQQNRGQERR